jgi:uncharacterized protein (UPF0332 family)
VALLNHDHLLEQAERLASTPARGKPRQADVRRAISAAYYAVFHFVVAAAADQFVGVTKRHTSEYGRVYRSIDHRALRELYEDLGKPTAPAKYRAHTPASGFGPNISAFVTAFVELQEKRHAADYDPMIKVTLSEAQLIIKTARVAIRRFEKTSGSRRRAFISLLLFPPRRHS